jgi:uncharacterized protein YjbI with pentapeptide repeats
MNEQDSIASKSTYLPKRPTTNSPDLWKSYWSARGQSWRVEPEIDVERQKFLAKRRRISTNVEQGIYPFKDIKLTRADIEWLLATHDEGRGPVRWDDEYQQKREGIDIRGADLRYENLRELPLTCLRAGLTEEELQNVTSAQRYMAEVHLERADLHKAHLEYANLRGAHLEGADLSEAYLEKSNLSETHLEGVDLRRAHLERADLSKAILEKSNLSEAHLEAVDLRRAHLEGANLFGAHLEGKLVPREESRRVREVDRDTTAMLEPADLRMAFFDSTTNLAGAVLSNEKYGSVRLNDVYWGGVNLTMVDWKQVKMLGDESIALQQKQIDAYRAAVRANRQLSVVLQEQGLNEEAARFAYRANRLQREVLRLQGLSALGKYLFSLFLDMLAGYGYKPGRSLTAYLSVILLFGLIYYWFGHIPLQGALLLSLTSFHGRGFFPNSNTNTAISNDPIAVLSAIEAVIGLLIEVSFIATLTQRLFGK